MYYLHMSPPVPAPPPIGSGVVRALTPSRPRSAAPAAVCVPVMSRPSTTTTAVVLPVKLATDQLPTAASSVRSSAYVGFSPRAPSATRPVIPVTATTAIGGNFQHVLQSHSSPSTPRRLSYGSPSHEKGGLFTPEPVSPPVAMSNPSSDAVVTAASLSTAKTTSNVYHAMTARKTAEETAKHLARRIAHYRMQEEKVLREVHQMKQRLEYMMASHEANAMNDGVEATTPGQKPGSTLNRPVSATTHASRMAQRSDVKTPRSREQLQFLTTQRRVIQARNGEAARQQKEKRQAALNLQRQKEAAESNRRAAVKERIRQERQFAIDQRAARQHQLLSTLEQQHFARLRQEQTREMEVSQRIKDMREEEQNLALRLQALQVHQEHMKRGLEESLHSRLTKCSSPLRPKSARPSLPTPQPATERRVELSTKSTPVQPAKMATKY